MQTRKVRTGGSKKKLSCEEISKYNFRIDPNTYKKNSASYLFFKEQKYKVGNYSYTFDELCNKPPKDYELVITDNAEFIDNLQKEYDHFYYDENYDERDLYHLLLPLKMQKKMHLGNK